VNDEITVLQEEVTAVTPPKPEPDVVTISGDDSGTVAIETADHVIVSGDQQDTAVVTEEKAIVVVSLGEQGPQGPAGADGNFIEVAFAYGDASPAVIATALAGKAVFQVGLHILVPFDGGAPELTIGDASNPDRLMAAHENDPTQVGSNTTAPAYVYGEDTELILTIVPGAGASQGSGLVTLSIQQ